ncbi:three-finger toxin MALT0070C-like [Acanthopagrus latus]|uniref:three-finger toxin MALT0070C-like n=1 Tax=Acanthopagrus latus TaxID=8177 RepID=UPI00187C0BE0|nr:three-finger toxin MALT0070C-like [Acanthopagrus latus]
MKFFGVLVLLATLSAAYGLRCYLCIYANPNSCTEVMTCPAGYDRCANVVTGDVVTRGCYTSAACVTAANCCSTDLCNGAITAGSSVLLLLVSSAITSLFL